MRTRDLLGGMLIAVVVLAVSACCSDDETLYKWDCNCDNVCAKDQEAAFDEADCYERNFCEPTGDTCECPGGASSC